MSPAVSRRGVLAGLGGAGLATVAAPAHAQQGRGARPPRAKEFVIEPGAALVPAGKGQRLLRNPSIRVSGDRIVEVREGPVRGGGPTLRLRDQLLLPGLISGHTHVAGGSCTRGTFEGSRSYVRPLELAEQLSDKDLDALTAYNLAELIRSGCTTQVEMSLSRRQAESYVRVAGPWGSRGYPGGMIPGVPRLFGFWPVVNEPAFEASIPETLKEIEAERQFGLRWNRSFEDRIRPMIAPHATDTHTPETIAAIVRVAKEVGNGIHLHLAQGAGEAATVQRRWGQRPVAWVDSLGMFDVPVFGAHMSGADLALDPALLAQRQYTYATCPLAGGANGSLQPYPEMLAAGVAVNIGIDTHTNDYLECLKLAVIKGQARHGAIGARGPVPSKSPTIHDAVRGATQVAADGLRRPDLGRIQVGAKADLVSVDVSGFLAGSGAMPPDPLVNLLYVNGLHARNVMTDGRWQLYDGELQVADAAQVARDGGRVVTKIWSQLRSEGWFDS
ncbi:MAG TPA: amidohydrolase family protein [Humibacillus xanthopallidus]|nr:amidohydrolase family protein [Humibacillus xanthopallidus]